MSAQNNIQTPSELGPDREPAFLRARALSTALHAVVELMLPSTDDLAARLRGGRLEVRVPRDRDRSDRRIVITWIAAS